jgi:integrase
VERERSERASASLDRSDTIELQTRSGLQITVPRSRWRYRDEVTIVDLDFSALSDLVSDTLLDSLQSVMSWHVERYAPMTLNNLMDRLKAMFRALAVSDHQKRNSITAADLINYRSHLGKQREYYFATLRSFLVRWSALGYPGVTDDAVEFVTDLKVGNNPRGNAVATLDPKQGPLTTIEHEGLLSELHGAYADGTIAPEAYHLSLLFTYFGARPTQYAAMKTKDISRNAGADGSVSFTLSIPRAKQGHKSARSEFTNRKLARVAAEPLWEYRQAVDAEAQRNGIELGEAPLFPDWESTPLPDTEFSYHQSAAELGNMLSGALRGLKVRSERTGERLHVTPVRFRRTIATNAAIEGKDVRTIAAILDHSDTQTANVYMGAVPEIVDRIDKAMAMDLAPLAQAFKGRLISAEQEATRGSDPTSRIVDLRIDRSGTALGSCGQHSFCGFNAPVACYTCRNFEPWLDGPHERVLETLLARRTQLERVGDRKIIEVNDRTILAVAEVIRLCAEKLKPKITV